MVVARAVVAVTWAVDAAAALVVPAVVAVARARAAVVSEAAKQVNGCLQA